MGLRMWWDDWLVVFGLRIWRDLYNESLLTFLHSDPSIASIHSTLRSQNGADISRCLGTERHPEHSLPGAIRWSANYTDYTPCRTWIQHFFLLIATHGWQWLTTLCVFLRGLLQKIKDNSHRSCLVWAWQFCSVNTLIFMYSCCFPFQSHDDWSCLN
jgi:hypothetical protein